ncbi:hypothetical protein [Streptomyces clavifer]|uniref:hypothetical protein n=1 Tax=Streptomyces clavifer TaxID=68188 RepID=UPI0036590D48
MDRITVDVEIDGTTHQFTLLLTELNKRTESYGALLGGDRTGLEAQVTVLEPGQDKGNTFFLSRLVGEGDWVIDAKFGPNSFPHWSHGFGARYTKLRGLLPEFGDVLDDAARERKLAAAIGRDVPLELAG